MQKGSNPINMKPEKGWIRGVKGSDILSHFLMLRHWLARDLARDLALNGNNKFRICLHGKKIVLKMLPN